MLCSAIELGVGEDADGILILDEGIPGQALGEVLALDTVLDLDVTTNRPDCLCHVGIARELAAALGEALNEPPAPYPRSSFRRRPPSCAPRSGSRIQTAARASRLG